MKGILTVGDLRRQIEGVPDSTPVLVWNDRTLLCELARVAQMTHVSKPTPRGYVGCSPEVAQAMHAVLVKS